MVSLWGHILNIEFSREDGWYFRYHVHLYPGVLPYRLLPQWRRWQHSPSVRANRCYLLVITWPHDSYEFGRHRKFGDDTREAILQVMTLSPNDEISDFHITIAVANELAVEFWVWTGRQYGRPDLKRLVVEDKDDGREISGPLHVVDDAEKVHRVLQHVKGRAESLVDTDGIDLS